MTSIMSNTTTAERVAMSAKDAALVAETGIAEDVSRARALGAEAGKGAVEAGMDAGALMAGTEPQDGDFEWARGEIGRTLTLEESAAFAEGYAAVVEA